MMTWWRENWRLYRIRCEIWSEINGIVNVTSFWVSSWDRGLLVPYLSLINKMFLVAKTVRLVMIWAKSPDIFKYHNGKGFWNNRTCLHIWTKIFKKDFMVVRRDLIPQINWSLRPTGPMPWTFVRLWEFLCVRDTGRRGNKITDGKSKESVHVFSGVWQTQTKGFSRILALS